MKPVLLDLFCGAGGATKGYQRAGFHVIGVDINPQPHYVGDEFHQADALEFLGEALDKFYPFNFADAIHASPPCQRYSTTASLHDNEYPDLIAPVRRLLEIAGEDVPYVIENVIGSPLKNPFKLCGSSFGLNVWRHRVFETNWDIGMMPPCSHREFPAPIDVTGTGSRRIYDRLDGAGGNSRKPRNLTEAGEAMGIGWMSRVELSKAIPPAYTRFIGERMMAHVRVPA